MMIFYITFDVLVDVLELFRTIPNYSELFRTKFELYFFGAVLPPNGSERFKCIEKMHKKVMFFDVKLCFAPVSPISKPQNIPRVNTKHQLKRQKLHRKSS